MKNAWLLIILVIAASLLIAPLGREILAAGPTSKNPVVLKFTSHLPPKHKISKMSAIPMCKAIEERTEGRVKFKFYFAQSLGKSKEQYNVVQSGLADMAQTPSTYVAGRFPLTEVGNLPYAAEDPNNLVKAMHTLMDKGYFDKEWNEAVLLAFGATSGYHFLFRKVKPMKFEELAGLKSRSPGGLLSSYLEDIGMVPVRILPGELFNAYDKGLVDAVTFPAQSFVSNKLHEISSKSFFKANYARFAALPTYFNKKKFESLPPDIQKVIREAAKEFSFGIVRSYTEPEEAALQTFRDAGIEVYSWPETEMAKLKGATTRVWDKFISDNEAKGHPARKLVKEIVKTLRELGEKPGYSP